MKKWTVISVASAAALCVVAQNRVFFNELNGLSSGVNLSDVKEITLDADATEFRVAVGDSTGVYVGSKLKNFNFNDDESVAVKINYTADGVTVVNPLAYEGVQVTVDGNDVIVNASTDAQVEYVLSGESSDGMFKIYSAKKYNLVLDGLNLTNADGPALNLQSKKKAMIQLPAGTENVIADGAKYADSDEDQKGTLFSEGTLEFSGEGTLSVSGASKHAIATDDDMNMLGGTVKVTSAASDGIHAKDGLIMSGGKIDVKGTGSDGIDGDEGAIEINGGEIVVNITNNDTKAIKCDLDFTMTDGALDITTSGGVVVTAGDPSYCSAIKTKANATISGGSIKVVSKGEAGKGISVDGDLAINGGTIDITTSGNGAKYTNASNQADSYSATCITVDGNCTINGGNITVASSGTAGKGIKADGTLTIGDGDGDPVVVAKTTGARITVSSSSWGPDSGDYANPKAIKATGNLTINSGHVTASTSQNGGEGIESKDTLTINGGEVVCECYDDGMNATNNITINGGKVYSYSSGNDGIDSNGTITITGGLVVSSGTTSPEEGFDCDQNTFKITGGTAIGIGGASSSPTSSVCTQRVVLWSTTGTQGQVIRVADSNGEEVFTFTLPRSYNQMTMLFTDPKLASGTTYSIYTGGTLTGAQEEWHGYSVGGTYTGGSSSTTFNPSSMVTTIGSSGSRPGGGGGGGRPGW